MKLLKPSSCFVYLYVYDCVYVWSIVFLCIKVNVCLKPSPESTYETENKHLNFDIKHIIKLLSTFLKAIIHHHEQFTLLCAYRVSNKGRKHGTRTHLHTQPRQLK